MSGCRRKQQRWKTSHYVYLSQHGRQPGIVLIIVCHNCVSVCKRGGALSSFRSVVLADFNRTADSYLLHNSVSLAEVFSHTR